ncbi:APC family permease [Plantibacter sp. YIM 135249]|uniref:APC family permease n=1 Tax=Plantibacter sp. YIM 135249 TaxID=3423918 RepID=UPI003D341D3A
MSVEQSVESAPTVRDAGAGAVPAPHDAAVAPQTGTIGLTLGAALYTAAVLGTGILLLPALAVKAAGPASIVAVAAVLLLSIPLAGTFAALASRHPDSGGVAHYVRIALGPTAARMTGYWFFFGVCVGSPVVAILGAQYVVASLGGAPWHVYLVALAILVPPFASNAFGLKLAGPVQLVLTGALVVLVVGVVLVSAPEVDTVQLRPFLPNGWSGVALAISLYVWAFAGWEAVTHIAGEFRNPRRTIPWATAIAVAVVGLAYLSLQFVTVTVLGERAGSSSVPLLDLVDASVPGAGRIAVTIVAVIVAVGVLNAYAGAFAKLGSALGRDGDLPRWFAKGSESGGIPRRALLLVGALALVYLSAVWVTGGGLEPFVLIHTSSMISVYALGVVAALRLLARWSAGWWMAVVSAVLVAGLLVLAGVALVVPASFAVVAIVVSAAKRSRARTRRRRGRDDADAIADVVGIADVAGAADIDGTADVDGSAAVDQPAGGGR